MRTHRRERRETRRHQDQLNSWKFFRKPSHAIAIAIFVSQRPAYWGACADAKSTLRAEYRVPSNTVDSDTFSPSRIWRKTLGAIASTETSYFLPSLWLSIAISFCERSTNVTRPVKVKVDPGLASTVIPHSSLRAPNSMLTSAPGTRVFYEPPWCPLRMV